MKHLILKSSLFLTALLTLPGLAAAGGGGDYNNPCLNGTSVPSGQRCPNEKFTTYKCALKTNGDVIGQVKGISLILRQDTVTQQIERHAFVTGNFPEAYRHSFYLPVEKIGSLAYRVYFPHPTYVPRTEFNLRIQILADKRSARINGTNNGLAIDQTVACAVTVL
jgi:hypothetical protein